MAYSDQGFRKADQDNKDALKAKGGLSGTPNAANLAWARAVYQRSDYTRVSQVALRKQVRDNGLEIVLSLVGVDVRLYADDEGDYFVDGGPRRKTLCPDFECAVNTFTCELARTVPS